MKNIFLILLMFPAFGFGQNTLSVEVQGVRNSQGTVNVAVYNQSNGFLEFDKVYKSDLAKANQGSTLVLLKGLPEGDYALAVFHDENGNEELDTNWLGIPKEDVGFSNAKMKTFGPPSFKECAFGLNEDSILTVVLE